MNGATPSTEGDCSSADGSSGYLTGGQVNAEVPSPAEEEYETAVKSVDSETEESSQGEVTSTPSIRMAGQSWSPSQPMSAQGLVQEHTAPDSVVDPARSEDISLHSREWQHVPATQANETELFHSGLVTLQGDGQSTPRVGPAPPPTHSGAPLHAPSHPDTSHADNVTTQVQHATTMAQHSDSSLPSSCPQGLDPNIVLDLAHTAPHTQTGPSTPYNYQDPPCTASVVPYSPNELAMLSLVASLSLSQYSGSIEGSSASWQCRRQNASETSQQNASSNSQQNAPVPHQENVFLMNSQQNAPVPHVEHVIMNSQQNASVPHQENVFLMNSQQNAPVPHQHSASVANHPNTPGNHQQNMPMTSPQNGPISNPQNVRMMTSGQSSPQSNVVWSSSGAQCPQAVHTYAQLASLSLGPNIPLSGNGQRTNTTQGMSEVQRPSYTTLPQRDLYEELAAMDRNPIWPTQLNNLGSLINNASVAPPSMNQRGQPATQPNAATRQHSAAANWSSNFKEVILPETLVLQLPHRILDFLASRLETQNGTNWRTLVELHGWNYEDTYYFGQRNHRDGIFQALLHTPDFQEYTVEDLRNDLLCMPRKDVLHKLEKQVEEFNQGVGTGQGRM